MKILISNDDGIHSQGILDLASSLEEIADVTVVAPHRERSTAGHSLTLHKPLRIFEIKPKYFAVTGTPADCIYVGTRHILKEKPDLVISGINRGANLGTDIYYSGTVAAAREGMLYGIRSVAVSLCAFHQGKDVEKYHWKTASSFMKKFAQKVFQSDFPINRILNINVPNVASEKIRGVKMGHMGRRYYHEEIIEREDPRKKKYYWIGGLYKDFDNIPDSDCVHVDQNYISVVPMKIDVTDYELQFQYKNWEEVLNEA